MKQKKLIKPRKYWLASVILINVFIFLCMLNGCVKKDDFNALETSNVKKTSDISMLETDFFKANKSLGGDVTIINSKLENKDSQLQKVFTIDVAIEDDYYLNAWLNSPELIKSEKGAFLSYDLIVNGSKLPSQFNVVKSGWHNAPYLNKSGNRTTIHLVKGINQIIFTCQGPITPAVDFVRLGKDLIRSNIQEDAYSKYIMDINNYMFCEITKDQYGNLMENIKENWKENKFTNDNKYIAPLPETFTKKYIKQILSRL